MKQDREPRNKHSGIRLHLSSRATIMKYHGLTGLNNRYLFSYSSGGWEAPIKVPTDLFPDKGSYWCPHDFSSVVHGLRESECTSSSSIRVGPYDLSLPLVLPHRPHL